MHGLQCYLYYIQELLWKKMEAHVASKIEIPELTRTKNIDFIILVRLLKLTSHKSKRKCWHPILLMEPG